MDKLKENDNMFDVRKIKDGTIVINKFKNIGYVLSSGMSSITVDYGYAFSIYPISFFNDSDWVKETFKQIGTYKFNEKGVCNTKTVRKLEPYRNSDLSQDSVNAIMVNKINEIIDKLNAMS